MVFGEPTWSFVGGGCFCGGEGLGREGRGGKEEGRERELRGLSSGSRSRCDAMDLLRTLLEGKDR